MTPEQRAALHAAMYEQPDEVDEPEFDPEAVEKQWTDKGFQIETAGKFVTILVDGKRITLPSVSYVSSLEKIITDQAREILRLKAQAKQVRTIVNQHTSEFTDVNRELDKKLNLRDRP